MLDHGLWGGALVTFEDEDADRGQAAFTRTGLALYDVLILGALCPWVWRCPNERILTAYRQHLSDNHLEVGVGT